MDLSEYDRDVIERELQRHISKWGNVCVKPQLKPHQTTTRVLSRLAWAYLEEGQSVHIDHPFVDNGIDRSDVVSVLHEASRYGIPGDGPNGTQWVLDQHGELVWFSDQGLEFVQSKAPDLNMQTLRENFGFLVENEAKVLKAFTEHGVNQQEGKWWTAHDIAKHTDLEIDSIWPRLSDLSTDYVRFRVDKTNDLYKYSLAYPVAFDHPRQAKLNDL